jgi:hypothetical protein
MLVEEAVANGARFSRACEVLESPRGDDDAIEVST